MEVDKDTNTSFEMQDKEIKKKVNKTVVLPPKKLNRFKSTNECNCNTLLESTHSFCSKNCSCSKIGFKCSVNCKCNGICSNSKPISDELFFKVWRNIVLRNQITGERRLEIIRKKNILIYHIKQILKYYNIKYDEEFTEKYVKLHYGSGPLNITYLLNNYYFKNEKYKRLKEFKNQFIKYNSSGINFNYSKFFRGLKSKIIRKYVNALKPEDKLKLNIQHLIIDEIKEIETIKESIRALFHFEELEFNINSKYIRSFIVKGHERNINSLITIEKCEQSRLKKNQLVQTLIGYGIYSYHYSSEIELYSNTFKKDEIISNNVWSFNKIIDKEKEYNNNQDKIIRENLVIKSLTSYGIIYRENSDIVNKFKNNIPPYTIEQVIEYENQSIELIKKIVINAFKKRGLKFNDRSKSYIDFIKKTGDCKNLRDINKSVKSFVDLESKNQKINKKKE